MTRPHKRPVPVAAAPRAIRAGASLAGALLAIAAGGSCEERPADEHVPEKRAEPAPNPEVPSHAEDPSPADALPAAQEDPTEPWVTPDGWTRDPAPRPMRIATFLAPDPAGQIEVALTRFPGTVGGELANVNRWRGQVGLPRISEAELDTTLRRFTTPGFNGYQTRIDGPGAVILAAGLYEVDRDRTWFVKATTTPESADRLESDLFGFARSIAGMDAGDG